MKKNIFLALALVPLLLVGCISVRRQTVTTGFGRQVGFCQEGNLNGKTRVLCPVCMFCPVGQQCYAKDDLGFYVKCPRTK